VESATSLPTLNTRTGRLRGREWERECGWGEKCKGEGEGGLWRVDIAIWRRRRRAAVYGLSTLKCSEEEDVVEYVDVRGWTCGNVDGRGREGV
jgi:hypothetical protein